MLDKNPINKINKHIEVVTTATLGMKETGFGSIETCKNVCEILRTNYTHVNFNEVASEQDLIGIADTNPDLVVLCVKYRLIVVYNENCLDHFPNHNFFGKLELQIESYLKIKSLLLSFRLLSFIQLCFFQSLSGNDAQLVYMLI